MIRERNGIRTHDHQSHNLALYHLSYTLHLAIDACDEDGIRTHNRLLRRQLL